MRRLPAAVTSILLLAACGGAGQGDGDRPPPADSGPGGPGPAASTPSADDGSAAGDSTRVEGRRPLRRRLVRLVNPGAEAVVVYASAGAGAVVLDSVAAGDSAEVTVESRSPRVGVRAMAGGRRVGADSVELEADGPARWSIPVAPADGPPPGAADTAGVEAGVSPRPRPGRSRSGPAG